MKYMCRKNAVTSNIRLHTKKKLKVCTFKLFVKIAQSGPHMFLQILVFLPILYFSSIIACLTLLVAIHCLFLSIAFLPCKCGIRFQQLLVATIKCFVFFNDTSTETIMLRALENCGEDRRGYKIIDGL